MAGPAKMAAPNMTGTEAVTLRVNGRTHNFALPGTTRLLYVLRNDLSLNGPKFGCGLGECGACSVLVDGRAVRSCCIAIATVRNREIITLEGLAEDGMPGRVQQAFIDAQAAQCGYCLNGMIVATEALLRRVPQPTEEQIRHELAHNLCRCGAHVEILDAVRRAAAAPAA